jgi:hypothetical protein
MPRFENPIEYQFAAEAAASLGRSGQLLRKALDALQKYDGDVLSGARRANPEARSGLVNTAGEAFWGYVVQRELLGLLDPEYIAKEYGVPPEVWQAMGPTRRSSGP